MLGARRLIFAAMACCLILTMLAAVNAEENTNWKDSKVTLKLSYTPFNAAIKHLFQGTGAAYTVEPGTEKLIVKHIELKGVSAEEALTELCNCAGATFRINKDGVVVISPKVTSPSE